mgnify:CR=1 FL=1
MAPALGSATFVEGAAREPYRFSGGRSSRSAPPFSALSLPSPAARAMARLRQASSCPLATIGHS